MAPWQVVHAHLSDPLTEAAKEKKPEEIQKLAAIHAVAASKIVQDY